MIIDRRQTHFFSFIILAVILPIIFLTGIIFTPEYPLNDSFAHNYPNHKIENIELNNPSFLSSGNLKFIVELISQKDSNLLVLEPISYLEIAEPLLYWQSVGEEPKQITEQSILLGEIKGQNKQIYTLPKEAQNSSGYLIIYSQVFQEIKATLAIDFSQS